jgi:hypothetical protein
MWRVLPKINGDLIEWKMVRYLTHRYFMQKSSLLIRGFEPMRQINSSSMGAASILETHVPSAVDATIKSDRAAQGYSLSEAAAMIATLEQLLRDDEAARLEKVYTYLKVPTNVGVNASHLGEILETYIVLFMMDGDEETIEALLVDPSLRHEVVPKWSEVRSFLDGLVLETEFRRHRVPQLGHALVAWSGLYSFIDAREVVSSITQTFASFWEDECQAIKSSLVAQDKSGTGRLSLTTFYGANAEGEWRFGESEAYLRDLGALDESSMIRGKQVVIPNYLQGASNCIVTTSHYLICCINECETILNDIEQVVGGPLASPEQVLSFIGNSTSTDDEPAKLDSPLRNQLERIGETHGGKVPIHGRLFAQWLHYVFPRDCPFPHKTGSRTTETPLQYGERSLATEDEVAKHAGMHTQPTPFDHEFEDAQSMSQWSEEEELLADYTSHLDTQLDLSRHCVVGSGVVLALFLSVGAAMSRRSASFASSGVRSEFASKAHFV